MTVSMMYRESLNKLMNMLHQVLYLKPLTLNLEIKL